MLGLPEDEARQIGDLMVAKGLLVCEEIDQDGGIRYRVCTARTRGHYLPPDL
jgi:hypothetical protein